MVKIEIYIEGAQKFEMEVDDLYSWSKLEVAEKLDEFLFETGIGDGSLRIFWANEQLKDESLPDLYVINADGNIHGEGHTHGW